VKESRKKLRARACLPGVNCGACGFTGSDEYAKALLSDPSLPANLCVPGADMVASSLAATLGKEAEDVIEMVAILACDGNCYATALKYDYTGPATCKAVSTLYSGNGKCAYGCIGYGDCAAVCPNDAICIKDGIAHIDTRKCIGCGMCAKVCPHHIISIMADVERVYVACSNKDKGAQTRKVCENGCIGCKKCEKTCEHGAITVIDNLAQIDYDKCVDCKKCVQACPVKCIIYKDLSGLHRGI
ncbi:MAG: RnfABCDGE type electron transport complex subunit B, partial [Clostridia bacterium]|nr:RnfABCDGE type electron transport complex subunit B [Clostridia bacterium]